MKYYFIILFAYVDYQIVLNEIVHFIRVNMLLDHDFLVVFLSEVCWFYRKHVPWVCNSLILTTKPL